jgi:hypothetical protein
MYGLIPSWIQNTYYQEVVKRRRWGLVEEDNPKEVS